MKSVASIYSSKNNKRVTKRKRTSFRLFVYGDQSHPWSCQWGGPLRTTCYQLPLDQHTSSLLLITRNPKSQLLTLTWTLTGKKTMGKSATYHSGIWNFRETWRKREGEKFGKPWPSSYQWERSNLILEGIELQREIWLETVQPASAMGNLWRRHLIFRVSGLGIFDFSEGFSVRASVSAHDWWISAVKRTVLTKYRPLQ